MDRIHGILERHERWIETLEPSGDDAAKSQHWDLIMHHIEKNLQAHEMLANTKSMGGYSIEEDERAARRRGAE